MDHAKVPIGLILLYSLKSYMKTRSHPPKCMPVTHIPLQPEQKGSSPACAMPSSSLTC